MLAQRRLCEIIAGWAGLAGYVEKEMRNVDLLSDGRLERGMYSVLEGLYLRVAF